MWDVLKEYPAARVRLEAIAVKRLEKYKKAPLEKGEDSEAQKQEAIRKSHLGIISQWRWGDASRRQDWSKREVAHRLRKCGCANQHTQRSPTTIRNQHTGNQLYIHITWPISELYIFEIQHTAGHPVHDWRAAARQSIQTANVRNPCRLRTLRARSVQYPMTDHAVRRFHGRNRNLSSEVSSNHLNQTRVTNHQHNMRTRPRRTYLRFADAFVGCRRSAVGLIA